MAHMDISPANIMVTPNLGSEWDRLRVLDMGLAQSFLPDLCLN